MLQKETTYLKFVVFLFLRRLADFPEAALAECLAWIREHFGGHVLRLVDCHFGGLPKRFSVPWMGLGQGPCTCPRTKLVLLELRRGWLFAFETRCKKLKSMDFPSGACLKVFSSGLESPGVTWQKKRQVQVVIRGTMPGAREKQKRFDGKPKDLAD